MNQEISWRTFFWGILLGAGFRIGWGLIALVIELAAKSIGAH